jgi:hypothetical protein
MGDTLNHRIPSVIHPATFNEFRLQFRPDGPAPLFVTVPRMIRTLATASCKIHASQAKSDHEV